jgi:bifunctional non-homologous end joining protein LigD
MAMPLRTLSPGGVGSYHCLEQVHRSVVKIEQMATKQEKIAPQLATLVTAPPIGPGWIHEIKYDGFRMSVRRAGDGVRVYSRNGLDWTTRLPSLAADAAKLKAESFTIDGEAAVLDAKGVSSFARMQDALSRTDDSKIMFFAFDLLELDGADLRKRPLVDRKAALRKLLSRGPSRLRYSEHLDTDGAAMLKRACEMGLEGIISKRADAPYRAGRNMDWQKSKCLKRQEFVLIGYWDRTNAAKDFGSLALAAHENGKLVYCGNVGTGWSDRDRKAIYPKLLAQRTEKAPMPLPKGVSSTGLHWLRPKLVGEVAFTEWTNDGIVRHPSFQGLREDKSANDIVIERPAGEPGLIVRSDWRRAGMHKK